MALSNQHEQLYNEIFFCRKCERVINNLVPRRFSKVSCVSDLVLMAQAPSENGVRKSGSHWVGEDMQLRRPGGVFLDNYLRLLGYSIDPEASEFRKPYTTNVLHCWTGRIGKRDRKPTANEIRNCKPWWQREIELVSPKVIILLGKPAAESLSALCGEHLSFSNLLTSQGQGIMFGDLLVKRFVVPHPTAPYVGKSAIYQNVINLVAQAL